jgi:hypothetical protein
MISNAYSANIPDVTGEVAEFVDITIPVSGIPSNIAKIFTQYFMTAFYRCFTVVHHLGVRKQGKL